MTSTSVRTQLDEFTVGFDETVGPELAAVFSGERDDLVAVGAPSGAVTAGDALPAASVVTVDGDTVDLADVLGAGPAVLVFYRGAWCPYCNITLKHYNETLAPELASRGVALVAISPQTPDGSRAAVANGDLGFTVVSDPGNTLASALGIVTAPSGEAQEAHTALGFAVKDSNADDTPAVPYPTVLVVDADRIVRTADVHVDYTTRTETEEILAAVDAL
ncbi:MULTISPECIES: peroxiredoxin-like family protein [unclassified Rathayibacter]|uniref:peroxiredoxin-like family protein n=1 Tax=unclassified Rathayibacter TaxID=2609250 RepID=UPI000CE8E048|nr:MULTISPECIES: peroxiredoxin-like family protein [unclassified Rathayibacter]PPF16200.1 peroxiredoxin [Rathayibacter sp. AY1A4]PPG77957.1 peroxiredoxin [Rathayibacter sp. AY1E5]PPH28124.1 peroxiredoxin [Rathayibacter sp. AY1C3]PPH63998.1 peroxiredoxin [Rathayibacter sp. AY1D7]PPI29913.1 peroxiredoxin [Rathayibacter sp. AY1B4]